MRRMITQKQIEELNDATEVVKKIKEYNETSINFDIDIYEEDIDWEAGTLAAFSAGYANEDEAPYYINDSSLYIYFNNSLKFNPAEIKNINALKNYMVNLFIANGGKIPEELGAYIDEFMFSNGFRSYGVIVIPEIDELIISKSDYRNYITIPIDPEGWEDDTGYVVANDNLYFIDTGQLKSNNIDTNRLVVNTVTNFNTSIDFFPEQIMTRADKVTVKNSKNNNVVTFNGSGHTFYLYAPNGQDQSLIINAASTPQFYMTYNHSTLNMELYSPTKLVLNSDLGVQINGDGNKRISFTSSSTIVEGEFDAQNAGKSYLKVDSLGHVIMEQLPITDPHVQGALWNDNGVLKISAGQ